MLLIFSFVLTTCLRCLYAIPCFDIANQHAVSSFAPILIQSVFTLLLHSLGTLLQEALPTSYPQVLLFFLCLAHYLLFQHLHYFNHTVIRFHLTRKTLFLVVSSVYLFFQLASNFTSLSGDWTSQYLATLPVLIVVVFFFVPAHYNQESRASYVLLSQKPIDTLYGIDKMVSLVDSVCCKKATEKDFQALAAVLQMHKTQCQSNDCLLGKIDLDTIRRGDFDAKTVEESVYKQLNRMLQQLKFRSRDKGLVQLVCMQLSYRRLGSKGIVRQILTFSFEGLDLFQTFTLESIISEIESEKTEQEKVIENKVSEMMELLLLNIGCNVTHLNQLWLLLSGNKCELERIYALVAEVQKSRLRIEDIWAQVCTYRNHNSYKIYSHYMRDVLQDRTSSTKLLLESEKILRHIRSRAFLAEKVFETDEEERGKIFLSLDAHSYGVMKKATLPACATFGYKDGELNNRRVNSIMPLVYSLHHDRFMLNYQRTGKYNLVNQDRTMLGKNSGGFVFEFDINIKIVLNSLSDRQEIVGIIHKHYYNNELIILVLDVHGYLMDISSTALPVFDIGLQQLSKRVHVESLVPRILKDPAFKVGRQVMVRAKWPAGRNRRLYYAKVSPLNSQTVGLLGYRVSLTFIKNFRELNMTALPPPFSFKPVVQPNKKLCYIGNSKRSMSMAETKILSSLKITSSARKESGVNFAEGIREQRFIDNKIIDLESQKSESSDGIMEEEEAVEEAKEPQGNHHKFSNTDIIKKLQSRKRLSLVLVTETTSFFTCLLCLIVTIFAASYANDYLASSFRKIQEIGIFTRSNSYLQYLGLYLVGSSASPPLSLVPRDSLRNKLLSLSNLSLRITSNLSSSISEDFSGQHAERSQFPFREVVGQYLAYFQEALSQSGQSPDQRRIKANLVFNGLQHSFESFKLNVERLRLNLVEEVRRGRSTLLTLLYIQLPFQVVHAVLTMFLLHLILQKKKKVLQLLLELPRVVCKRFEERGNQFLAKLENREDVEKMDDDEENVRSNSSQYKNIKKRTILENKFAKYFTVLVLGFFQLVLLSYLAVALIAYSSHISMLQENASQIVDISSLQPSVVYLMNVGICSKIDCESFSDVGVSESLRLFSKFSSELDAKNRLVIEYYQDQKYFIYTQFSQKFRAITFDSSKELPRCNNFVICWDYFQTWLLQKKLQRGELERLSAILERELSPFCRKLSDLVEAQNSSLFGVLAMWLTAAAAVYSVGIVLLYLLVVRRALLSEEEDMHALQAMVIYLPPEEVSKYRPIEEYIKDNIINSY